MKLFKRSEPGAWVSGAAHAALLVTAVVGLASPRFPDAQEGIAVEVLTDNQFSEITRGEKQAEAVRPELTPRVDRVAEAVEERDPGEASRLAPSPATRPLEMKTAEREVAPPPPLPPRRDVAKVEPPPEPPRREVERRPERVEPKPEAKPEAKREDQAKLAREAEEAAEKAEAKEAAEREKAAAEAKAADAKARAEAQARAKAESEAKARADAEAKAKAEAEAKAKAEAKAVAEAKAAEAKLKAEARAKAEAEARAKRQAEVADRFNPGDIRQLLASREPAQATGSTGREVQRTAALGTATGTAQKLNPSQRDSLVGFLQDQIQSNYYKVPGSDNDAVVLPVMEIRLNADGSLAADPRLLRVGPKPIDRAVAEAALRAVRRAAPFRVPAQFTPFYGDWKLLNVEFTPT